MILTSLFLVPPTLDVLPTLRKILFDLGVSLVPLPDPTDEIGLFRS